MVGKSLIIVTIGSIQGDIHPSRRIFVEELRHGFIDHRTIGIDGEDEAHLLQFCIEFLKTWIEHGFTTGEEDEQGAQLLEFTCDIKPFLYGMEATQLIHDGLLGADEAHVATEVADGCQLKVDREGYLSLVGLRHQTLF